MIGGDIWFSGIVIGRTAPPSGAPTPGAGPVPGAPPIGLFIAAGGGAADATRGFAICELSSLSSIDENALF